MKANELRIGNLYYWIGNGFNEPLKVDVDCFVHWKPNLMDPIPITPEILEKCGFEDVYDNGRYFFEGYWYYDDILWFMTSAIYCPYLHQLQNLYFALTAEELNIQL